ncbi:hypothetical protein B4124_4123 [Bacillus licheniformis]|nr:hypothetical protein B4124_4123 [Bacillus licheniformis]TWN00860.1 hypothetical protein CHCC14568_0706 [Bacillus licheniformis]
MDNAAAVYIRRKSLRIQPEIVKMSLFQVQVKSIKAGI